MKQKTNPLLGLLFIAVMAFFLSSLFAPGYWTPFFVCLTLASIVVPKDMAFMAVTVEIWQKDIIGNLFKDNQFAQESSNESQYVIGGKIVHIPTAGAPSASIKNASTFPMDAVKRADSEILYALDTYYQAPKFVEKVEQYELSYDKRQSIMGEQQSQLIQDSIDGLLIRWAYKGTDMTTKGNFVLTTNSTTTSTDLANGATGTRLIFDKSVFGVIKKKMDVANISPNGRLAVLTAYHHQQLLDTLSDPERTNFYRYADMATGVVGMYLGFKVYMRSTVQIWRKASSVWSPVDTQASGYAASTKDNDSAASIFYQKDCVSRALGDVNVFDNPNRADYFGDVMSMNMRLGGRTKRDLGVYSVVEDIGA